MEKNFSQSGLIKSVVFHTKSEGICFIDEMKVTKSLIVNLP